MTNAPSKSAELLAAARARAAAAREAEEKINADGTAVETETEVDNKIAAAELAAETRVQSRDGTLTGEIDVTAMGDVKGDGRDANEYPDSDPAKALGVPTYEHGLHADPQDNAEAPVPRVTRISEKTRLERERGRQAIAARNSGDERTASRKPFKTVIEDGDDTPPPPAKPKAKAKTSK